MTSLLHRLCCAAALTLRLQGSAERHVVRGKWHLFQWISKGQNGTNRKASKASLGSAMGSSCPCVLPDCVDECNTRCLFRCVGCLMAVFIIGGFGYGFYVDPVGMAIVISIGFVLGLARAGILGPLCYCMCNSTFGRLFRCLYSLMNFLACGCLHCIISFAKETRSETNRFYLRTLLKRRHLSYSTACKILRKKRYLEMGGLELALKCIGVIRNEIIDKTSLCQDTSNLILEYADWRWTIAPNLVRYPSSLMVIPAPKTRSNYSREIGEGTGEIFDSKSRHRAAFMFSLPTFDRDTRGKKDGYDLVEQPNSEIKSNSKAAEIHSNTLSSIISLNHQSECFYTEVKQSTEAKALTEDINQMHDQL